MLWWENPLRWIGVAQTKFVKDYHFYIYYIDNKAVFYFKTFFHPLFQREN
jgi:hypothetical protein